MFPATYDYVTMSGKIVQKKLFGNLIARIDRMLDDPRKTDRLLGRFNRKHLADEGLALLRYTATAHGHRDVDNRGLVVPDVSARARGLRDGAAGSPTTLGASASHASALRASAPRASAAQTIWERSDSGEIWF